MSLVNVVIVVCVSIVVFFVLVLLLTSFYDSLIKRIQWRDERTNNRFLKLEEQIGDKAKEDISIDELKEEYNKLMHDYLFSFIDKHPSRQKDDSFHTEIREKYNDLLFRTASALNQVEVVNRTVKECCELRKEDRKEIKELKDKIENMYCADDDDDDYDDYYHKGDTIEIPLPANALITTKKTIELKKNSVLYNIAGLAADKVVISNDLLYDIVRGINNCLREFYENQTILCKAINDIIM